MRGDNGSYASELYAFRHLGLDKERCIRSECELMRECTDGPVPEGIWEVDEGRRISVEVKRIAGNTLPTIHNPDGRRCIVKRGRIVWPWESTVEYAIHKCKSQAVTDHRVDVHYAVFLIPESMSQPVQLRTYRHIQQTAQRTIDAIRSEERLSVKVRAIMTRAPDAVFDRL